MVNIMAVATTRIVDFMEEVPLIVGTINPHIITVHQPLDEAV